MDQVIKSFRRDGQAIKDDFYKILDILVANAAMGDM